MRRSVKRFFLINGIVLLLSSLCILLAFFGSRSTLELVVTLCCISLFSSLFLTLMYCISDLFNCLFADNEIKVRWANLTYKRIPYSKIEGITVEGAVGYRYKIPFRDKSKKQKAALVLYESNVSFLEDIKSNSECTKPFPSLVNALCGSFLEEKDLQILLDKTTLPIYVTEQMLTLHQEKLKKILSSSPDRFIIAYYDRLGGIEQKMPYPKFVDTFLSSRGRNS